MTISRITKEQWVKVLKATAYSFVSTFIATVVATSDFSKAGLYSALVASVNASLVVVKQLFTDPN